MVESISPNYYAANVPSNVYNLYGSGFSVIPAGAVGILANSNSSPLAYRYNQEGSVLFDIEVIDDNHLIATSRNPTTHISDNYLGAIVSSNRQVVIWTNTTSPLP